MAQEQSKVVFSADDSDLQAAWEKQFRALQRLNQLLEKTGRTSQKTSGGAIAALGKWIAKMGALTKAAEIATGALKSLADAQLRVNKMEEEGTRASDTAFRDFLVQGGIDPGSKRAAEMKSMFGKLATDFGKNRDTAIIPLAHQLRSVDVGTTSDEELLAVMTETLKLQAATPGVGGQQPADSDTARATARVLEAFGMDKSPENFNRFGRAFATLYGSKDIQVQDVNKIATSAAALAGQGVSLEQALAMSAELAVFDAPERQTQTKNAVLALRTASNERAKEAALRSIGLSQEDVATADPLVGLERYAAALQKVDPQKRTLTNARIFGRENISLAELLMRELPDIRAWETKLGSDEALNRGVQIYMASPATVADRSEERRRLSYVNSQEARDRELMRKEAEAYSPTMYAFHDDLGNLLGNVPVIGGWLQSQNRQRQDAMLGHYGEAVHRWRELESDIIGDRLTRPLEEIRDETRRAADAAERANDRPNGIPPGHKPAEGFQQ